MPKKLAKMGVSGNSPAQRSAAPRRVRACGRAESVEDCCVRPERAKRSPRAGAMPAAGQTANSRRGRLRCCQRGDATVAAMCPCPAHEIRCWSGDAQAPSSRGATVNASVSMSPADSPAGSERLGWGRQRDTRAVLTTAKHSEAAAGVARAAQQRPTNAASSASTADSANSAMHSRDSTLRRL